MKQKVSLVFREKINHVYNQLVDILDHPEEFGNNNEIFGNLEYIFERVTKIINERVL